MLAPRPARSEHLPGSLHYPGNVESGLDRYGCPMRRAFCDVRACPELVEGVGILASDS